MRFGWMAAAAAMVMAAPASAESIQLTEIEPNDSPATAQALPPVLGNSLRISGFLEGNTFSNVDWFSFNVDTSICEAGRPNCYLITIFAGLSQPDPFITLLNPSGVDVSPNPDVHFLQTYSDLAGTWTLGIRRSTAATPRDYTIGLVVAGAVPEPSAWVLMIGGIGLAGALVRRRRAMDMSAVPAQT